MVFEGVRDRKMQDWQEGDSDPFSLVDFAEERAEDEGEFILEEGLFLEEGARDRLREIVEKRGSDWMLRVVIEGGGCSGYRVLFELDNKRSEEDILCGDEGARVVIDRASLHFVRGSRVRHNEGFGGSFFFLDVPHASSGCGCGESFSL
jgi:iron-sulfur cluster insertion protein